VFLRSCQCHHVHARSDAWARPRVRTRTYAPTHPRTRARTHAHARPAARLARARAHLHGRVQAGRGGQVPREAHVRVEPRVAHDGGQRGRHEAQVGAEQRGPVEAHVQAGLVLERQREHAQQALGARANGHRVDVAHACVPVAREALVRAPRRRQALSTSTGCSRRAAAPPQRQTARPTRPRTCALQGQPVVGRRHAVLQRPRQRLAAARLLLRCCCHCRRRALLPRLHLRCAAAEQQLHAAAAAGDGRDHVGDGRRLVAAAHGAHDQERALVRRHHRHAARTATKARRGSHMRSGRECAAQPGAGDAVHAQLGRDTPQAARPSTPSTRAHRNARSTTTTHAHLA
jgi:hypothetical protein